MATNQKQEVELLIKAGTEGLRSIGQLVKELDALGEDTGEASEQLQGLAGSLKELKDQQRLVKQFADLKRETRDLARDQQTAKERATELGKALADTEKPTRAQTDEFKKARSASRQADQAWQSNQQRLNQLRDSLNEAGISTTDLAGEQQRVKSEIRGVDQQIGGLASELTQLRDSAGEASEGTRQLSDEAEQGTTRLGRFQKRLSGLNPILGKVGSGLKAVGSAIAGATAAVAAGAATLTVFTKSQADLANELNNTSQALGLSREEIQLWRIAGERLGMEGDKITDVLRDVTERLGEFAATGTGEAADVLDTLNIKIRDLRDLSPDQQLLKLAEAIDQVGSKSEQVALLEQLASDASQLQPLLTNNAALLRQVAEEARAAGAIYSDEDLEKLTRANEIYEKVDLRIKGLVRRLGSELAPVVSDATNAVLKLFDQEEGGQKLVDLFRSLIRSAQRFATGLIENQESIRSGFEGIVQTLQFFGNTARAVFSSLQTVVAGWTTLVSGSLSTLLTAVQGVAKGLNAIGVVSDSAYSAVKARAEAARQSTVDLAKQTAEYGKNAVRAGADAFGAFSETEKAAKKSGDEVRKTAEETKKAADEQAKSQPKVIELIDDQARATERARSELQKLGVDAGAALEGISSDARASISSLTEIADEIEQIGVNSEKSADIFLNGVGNALTEISTAEEFRLIEQQVRELFSEDKIDNRALQQALTEIKERQQEIAGEDISSSTDDLKESADKAADSVENLEDKLKAAEEEAKQARDEFREAWGASFGAALTSARESVTALSNAARNLFESRTGGNAFVQETIETRDALEQARQEVGELDRAAGRLRNNTFAEWFNNVALQAARARQEFFQQKLQLEDLTASVEAGQYSMSQLDQLSQSAASQFDLLDSQQLSGLQSAIESARSRMESLNSSAESTLNSLRQRLADISGDTEEAQRLQYEAERERLQAQLDEAREAGATSAAADYSAALQQLQKINEIEQRNRREEENQRERAAADRQREQEQAERERQQARREQSTTTNQQQSQPAPSGQRITLQAPSGREVDVETRDPGALLAALEEAGLRSVS